MTNQRNNLIPTVVTDKNGKLTTVHKRPVTSSIPALASVMPLPPTSHDSTFKQLHILFEDVFASMNIRNDQQTILKTLHPDTMNLMAATYRGGSSSFGIDSAIRNGVSEGKFELLNNLAHLNYDTIGHDNAWWINTIHVMNGVRSMVSLLKDQKMIDFTDKDDPDLHGGEELIKALLSPDNSDLKGSSFNIFGQTTTVFHHPQISGLIIKNPQRTQEIITLYRDYGSYNREVFTEALASTTPSLNNGIL